jgi:hypothetical protein
MVFVVTKLVKDISLIELVTILMRFGGFAVPSTSEIARAMARFTESKRANATNSSLTYQRCPENLVTAALDIAELMSSYAFRF